MTVSECTKILGFTVAPSPPDQCLLPNIKLNMQKLFLRTFFFLLTY